MLNWGGATGTMPLNGSAYLLFIQTPPVAAALPTGVPLSVVGVGGTAIAGGLVASVIGAPFQLGAVVGTGTLLGSATQQTATGFDARTAGGAGVLQIVSPTRVNLGGLVAGDYVSALAILNLNFTPVPEPTTGILLGAGVLALAAAGGLRRRSRRRIE